MVMLPGILRKNSVCHEIIPVWILLQDIGQTSGAGCHKAGCVIEASWWDVFCSMADVI